MRKNRCLFALVCALTFAVAAACAPAQQPQAQRPAAEATAAPEETTEGTTVESTLPAIEQTAATPETEQAAAGANAFAYKLAAALYAQNEGKNFICSPLSAWLPLAALYNVTDEEHRAALADALEAQGLDASALNKAAQRMLSSLMRVSQNAEAEEYGMERYDPLKIANAVFVGENVTLNDDFAQMFRENYLGEAMRVDFASQEAVDAVNQWASEQTDGLIENIVDSFEQNTVAAIANAIYFADRWASEFDETLSYEDVFHAAGGDSTATYMVKEGDEQLYFEDDALQAMPLYTMTGGCMYILLPKDGDAASLLNTLTPERLEQIRTEAEKSTGKLLLPRFEIENTLDGLKDALVGMGVPLFDEKSAPLTGRLIDEDIPVWLSDAVQKAMIKVDEKGTTAAAVTVMIASGASLPVPTEPFEMKCDKPFVFVLCGDAADSVDQALFIGLVADPAK